MSAEKNLDHKIDLVEKRRKKREQQKREYDKFYSAAYDARAMHGFGRPAKNKLRVFV